MIQFVATDFINQIAKEPNRRQAARRWARSFATTSTSIGYQVFIN
jgi:hypothetical protein